MLRHLKFLLVEFVFSSLFICVVRSQLFFPHSRQSLWHGYFGMHHNNRLVLDILHEGVRSAGKSRIFLSRRLTSTSWN